MLGEVTPQMAEAVTSSPAMKIFLPIYWESIQIVNVQKKPLPHLAQKAVATIKEVIYDV